MTKFKRRDLSGMRTPIDDIKDFMAHAGEENPFELRAKLIDRFKKKLKLTSK